MEDHHTTPPAFVVFAVAGGLLFMLGGLITAASSDERAVLAAGAIAFVLLGFYAVATVIRHNRLVAEMRVLSRSLQEAHKSDRAMRTRVAVTLREPVTTIVGFADALVERDDMSTDQRRAMTRELLANAREVDQALAGLASEGSIGVTGRVDGVVLLDHELMSIASSIVGDLEFETWFAPSRAWGDSALVRQILRTILSGARSNGCRSLVLKTDRRGDRVAATISGRCELLPAEGIAALTGNAHGGDLMDEQYLILRDARAAAASMGGTIGYAEALGVSHIVVELPAAPEDVNLNTPRQRAPEGRRTAGTAGRNSVIAPVEMSGDRFTPVIRFTREIAS
ncbi:MAG TPA: hypothetical protein VLA29_00820 [Acidimicrobiia bacterium]|nr:hypothetical protein [Acidimicrobiia bacterium]